MSARCWLRRQGRPISFVQDLFGLLMQAPCPSDYQDSPPSADAAPASKPAAVVAAAAAPGAREGSPRTADDAQSWRRQAPLPQSGRSNGQVRC